MQSEGGLLWGGPARLGWSGWWVAALYCDGPCTRPINKSGRAYYYRMTDVALLFDERVTQEPDPYYYSELRVEDLAAWSRWIEGASPHFEICF